MKSIDTKQFNFGYCYSCRVYFRNFSPFGSVFIDYEHFFGRFFKAEEERCFVEECALFLQKQLLANEIKICSSYIYCALDATPKSDLELLFDFINFFKEYLKQPIQNGLKNACFRFPIFTATQGG